MSWDRVRTWRDLLRDGIDTTPLAGLSPSGSTAAWIAALDALDDDTLTRVAALPGAPFDRAVVVVARTVSTAAIEWCAVLLGRGTAVHLKHPHDAPGSAPALVEAARRAGLPLSAGPARDAVATAPLVVVMGGDRTVEAVTAAAAGSTVLGFGHRFSVAWITDLASLPEVAEAAALHDGRGCLSPVAVLTPLDAGVVGAALAVELERAQARWPRGEVGAAEHAHIRTRRALATVLGRAWHGEGWDLHALPAGRFNPAALPRALAVHHTPNPHAVLAPWSRWLSTVGSDDAQLVLPWGRVCAPGALQRPPLERLHDGVDWLRATLRRA